MTSQDPLDLLVASIRDSLSPVLLTPELSPSTTLSTAAWLSFPQSGAAPINLPKDVPTRYTSKADSSDEFYSLGQLWLAWTERATAVREYLIKGTSEGVGYVTITDRRGVVDYLEGGRDASGRVVSQDGRVKEEKVLSSTIVENLPNALEHQAEAGPSRQTTKRKYEVDVADREFCKKLREEEVELRNHNSVLRSAGGGKVNNFSSFLSTQMADKIKSLRSSLTSSRPAATPVPQDLNRAKKSKSSNPIIMISSSPTSLITMWNVKKFLEQGSYGWWFFAYEDPKLIRSMNRFEPSDVARANEAAVGNTRAEDMIPVLRKRSGQNGDITSKYYVVDGVEALQKFGQDAWDRVICVLTTGQAWQFRPYKWQDPKQLFRNVKGVYFQWSNEPVNQSIKDWNVTELRIDKQKRHTDRQVVAEFWRVLDGAKRR
ncbi:parafibromin, partial [Tremellales sp. Uapishka_1]